MENSLSLDLPTAVEEVADYPGHDARGGGEDFVGDVRRYDRMGASTPTYLSRPRKIEAVGIETVL